MASKKFTALSSTFTRWKRLKEVSIAARWVYIALYTSTEAKGCPTGLFFGSQVSIANAAGMQPDEIYKPMDELIRARFILWDMSNELVRIIELPDNLERAHSDQAIHGWWSRFNNIPQCALRDSHIPQLWNLVMSGQVGDKMRKVWRETFGTVLVPKNLPLLPGPYSSDTSTRAQPSLFGHSASLEAASSAVPAPLLPSGPTDVSENQNPMISGTVDPARGSGKGTGTGKGYSGEGESAGPDVEDEDPVLVGPWQGTRERHLALVPAPPPVPVPDSVPSAEAIQDLPDREAEARNARAGEMAALWHEAARAAGADFLIPYPPPPPKDPE